MENQIKDTETLREHFDLLYQEIRVESKNITDRIQNYLKRESLPLTEINILYFNPLSIWLTNYLQKYSETDKRVLASYFCFYVLRILPLVLYDAELIRDDNSISYPNWLWLIFLGIPIFLPYLSKEDRKETLENAKKAIKKADDILQGTIHWERYQGLKQVFESFRF